MTKGKEAPPDNSAERELRTKIASLDRKVFELTSLLKSGRAMSNILNPDHLYSVITNIVREKLDACNVALYLFEEPNHTFRMVHNDGLAEDCPVVFNVDEGLLWQSILQNEPFRVVDVAGKPLFASFFDKHDLNQIDSAVWVPLIMLDNVVGLLSVGSRAGQDEYAGLDLNFMKQIAAQASVSLNTSMLVEKRRKEQDEMTKTVHNLSLLYNIGRAMTYIHDLKNLLAYILKQAIEITRAEKGSIMLHDADTNRLQIRVIEGLPDAELQEKINNGEVATQSFKPGEGVAGKVFESGNPIYLNNIGEDSEFVRAGKSFVNSIACIPMKVYGDVIGVINVTNKTDGSDYTNEDEELLKAVADQAAVAVNKAQLWEMAVTDLLTGLYIRRFFLAKLNEEHRRSERYSKTFSVVMIDIDKFKNINDTYGHGEGDVVIRSLGHLLAQKIRTVDLAARYGGEEFVVLLPETDKESALIMAERFRESVELLTFENVPGITASMGIANFPEDSTDMNEVIKMADAAMYHAKRTGRNRVVTFEPSMQLIPPKNGETKPAEESESNAD